MHQYKGESELPLFEIEDKQTDNRPLFPNNFESEKVELPKWLSPTRTTLNHYLAEVDKTPRLSAEEEVTLGQLGINKPKEDVWKLVLHNRPLAVHYASLTQAAHPSIGLSLIDFLDIANPALFRSGEKYDSGVIGKKGLPVRFGYFAGNLIRMKLRNAVVKQEFRNSTHISLDGAQEAGDEEGLLYHELIADKNAENPSEVLAESDIPRLVDLTFANMDSSWQKKYGALVRSRLGMDNGLKSRNYNEVAAHMGSTWQNVREKLVTRAMPAFRIVFSRIRDHPELYSTNPRQVSLL